MMFKAGVEADAISCNTLVKAWVEARDVTIAGCWLFMMSRAGVRAYTTSYTALIQACADYDVAKFEHLLSVIVKSGAEANISSHNFVSKAFADACDVPELSISCP